MKNTLTETKSNLQEINSGVENKISNLEYKEARNTQKEQQKEKYSK